MARGRGSWRTTCWRSFPRSASDEDAPCPLPAQSRHPFYPSGSQVVRSQGFNGATQMCSQAHRERQRHKGRVWRGRDVASPRSEASEVCMPCTRQSVSTTPMLRVGGHAGGSDLDAKAAPACCNGSGRAHLLGRKVDRPMPGFGHRFRRNRVRPQATRRRLQ